MVREPRRAIQGYAFSLESFRNQMWGKFRKINTQVFHLGKANPEDAQAHNCLDTGRVYLLLLHGRQSRTEQVEGQAGVRMVCLLHCPLTCLSEYFRGRWIQMAYLSHFLRGPFIFFLAPKLFNKIHWEDVSPLPTLSLDLGWKKHQSWLSALTQILPPLWVLLVKASMISFSPEL